MSQYTVEISWQRAGADFTDGRYSRAHVWRFDGGAEVQASSSPHVVPLPYSNDACVDPEEAFVAALSSCHMLWFLSIAAKRNFVVEKYVDHASGIMERNSQGKLAITRVNLHPRVTFGSRPPSTGEFNTMHNESHEACFIANSVTTIVRCEPAFG
jgi:organic hydroperoxide reductase OsmC/OhrA